MYPDMGDDDCYETVTFSPYTKAFVGSVGTIMDFYKAAKLVGDHDHRSHSPSSLSPSPYQSSTVVNSSDWANLKYKLERLSSPVPSPTPSLVSMQSPGISTTGLISPMGLSPVGLSPSGGATPMGPFSSPPHSSSVVGSSMMPLSPVGSSGKVDSPPGPNMLVKQESQDFNMNLSPGAFSHQYNPYSFTISQSQPSNPQAPTSTYLHTTQINDASRPYSSDSPPPPPRVYKPCFVCQDKSSGYHYGVSACEGCKGFFRRSVQKNMSYTCHRDKNCDINKITRNRCQYCRFQKCFAVGMSKDCVRNDRNKKKKESAEVSQSTTIPTEIEDVIKSVTKAHNETFLAENKSPAFPVPQRPSPSAAGSSSSAADTPIMDPSDIANTVASLSDDDFIQSLWDSSLIFDLTSPMAPQVDPGTQTDPTMLDCVTTVSTKAIVMVVDFAKKLPGFMTLSTADQITLLKAACLEILTLRISAKFSPKEGAVTFSGGMTLDKEQLQTGGFGPLMDDIVKLSQSFRKLRIDGSEMALLAAVCLISGDRTGLEDPQAVERMQEPYLEGLRMYVHKRRPKESNAFAKILMKITDVRHISVMSAEKVMKIKMDMPGEIPPLIDEMVDRLEED